MRAPRSLVAVVLVVCSAALIAQPPPIVDPRLFRSGIEVTSITATVGLYFMYYNFARVHQTLRVTSAMEAGIADHIWSIEEIVGPLQD